MKLVDVIQEVRFLPGQRLATSPVAKPVGWRKQKSEARWSKLIGLVLSLESVHRRGPVRDKPPRAAWLGACERGQSQRAGTQYLAGCYGKSGKGPPGSQTRACQHRDDTGTRESLIASCPLQRGSIRGNTRGSPPRHQSSLPERPAAPPGRSPECKQKRRRQVRRDELDSEGTPDER